MINRRVSKRVDVVVNFLFGVFFSVAVTLLELAHERVLFAADQLPVVVGELGPLRFHLRGKLRPLAFDLIPVHRSLLWPWVKGTHPVSHETAATGTVCPSVSPPFDRLSARRELGQGPGLPRSAAVGGVPAMPSSNCLEPPVDEVGVHCA